MASEQVRDGWGTDWRRMLVAGLILLLPLLVVVLDFDAGVLAGCGGYGYGCSEPACFTVQISTNQGYTWQKGTAWVYGPPGSQIDLYVRTTMSTNVYQVEGWSFGVAHSAPTLEGSGGSLVLSAAAAGPDVQTVQGGAPPDFVSTRVWTCGLTQGLAIDMGATHITLGPRTNFVTAVACYRLTFPSGYSVHTATLEFNGEVGVPPVASIVTRQGQTLVPCKEALTLRIQPTTYYPTPSYCPMSAMEADPCAEGEEGARVARGAAAPRGGSGGCEVHSVLTVLSDVDPQTGEAPGAVNDYPGITAVKLWRGFGEPPGSALEWTGLTYDEQDWEDVGSLPIGYGAEDLGFTLEDMQGSYSTFYLRVRFQLPLDPAFDEDLYGTLEADLGVNDGFVAYVNGVEIRRMNAPGPFLPPHEVQEAVRFNSVAESAHRVEDRVSGYHDLHAAPPDAARLVAGEENVLAIHVLNFLKTDAACVLSPRLHVRKRGPFVAKASEQALADPTAFEVVARLPDCTEAENVWVDYEYLDAGGQLVQATSTEVLVDHGTGEESGTTFRVQVPGAGNPPLPHSTQVTYRLWFDHGGDKLFEETPLTMVTARSPTEPLRFVALGQTGSRGTAWGEPGIYPDPGVVQDDLATALEGMDFEFALVAGDMNIRNNVYRTGANSGLPALASIERGLTVEAIDHRFYNPYSGWMCRSPFYVAPGDEDLERREHIPQGQFQRMGEFLDLAGIDSDADYATSYVLPLGPAPLTEPDGKTEHFYSFEVSNAHFSVLRSTYHHEPTWPFPGTLGLIPLPQYQVEFLRDGLRMSDRHWKILVVHHPPHTSQLTDLDGDSVADRDQWLQGLEFYFGGFENLGVDLVISAHEKSFELTKALTASVGPMGVTRTVVQDGPDFLNPGAPVYITTGGGGERLWEPQDPKADSTQVIVKEHHVVALTIDGEVLTIDAIDEDGQPIDGTSATILKSIRFRRGDSNDDGEVNITDPVFTLNYLFLGGDSPVCEDAVDANDDGEANLTDPIFTLNYLFLGGTAPLAPGPDTCGVDPTPDSLPPCAYTRCLGNEKGRCYDDVDNDDDGVTDCADPDCNSDPLSEWCRCDDGIDNDGDGDVDCADDLDCRPDPACH